MCGKCIVGQSVITAQMQVTLTGLEEHLDVPAPPVEADDFLLTLSFGLKE